MPNVNRKLSISSVENAFFIRTGRNTKKLPHSKLFLWMVFKHGLLEGSTILLKYTAITRTLLESSSLGELKYAISPGEDVRPKTKSIRKCKKWHCETWSWYMVNVLRTGSDKFGQVWPSQNTCGALFFLNRESHAVQTWSTPKPVCSFLTVPCLKLYDPPKSWKQRSVTLQLA